MALAPSGEQATPMVDEIQPTGPAADGQVAKQTSGWTKARRTAAAAMLLGWVVVVWISFQTPFLHACDDQVARVGGAALVRSCRPLSITDAPTLALLVGAGVLLFADLSALEIPGVLRLERQVKEQAKRQDEIVAMVHRLEVVQRQRQEVNVYTAAEDAAKVVELAAQQEEKRHLFGSDA